MYSVLVVDDNKTNLQLLKQLLSKQYNVIPVLSGKLALHYVEKRRPDIILLDLLMPEMDGMAVLEALKRMPSAKDIPIIFLTADNEKETENSCLKAGAADFIAKPFVPEVMITRIEKALELAQLRSKLQSKMEENTREFEEAARSHHERYDGTGYPNGLKGEEIPIAARIISIVDAYFAMISDRAYRRRLTKEEACEEIRRMAGTQFGPMLAKEFLAMVEEGELNEQYMEQLAPQTCSRGSGELIHQSNQLVKCILKEQNYVINSMASIDPLTELHNRKYLEVRVHAYLEELSSKGCFCMIDVDNFKQINDVYGYQKGDQVLQSLAEILKRNARETDVVCRIGGDEFVIFYEGLTNHEVIKRKMEQVGREYEKEVLRERVVVDTSLSIGVSITGEQGREYEELYKKADEALYSVKQGGKCRVMICGEE